VITFSGMSLPIGAGQTADLMLAIDVAGGLSAGNTTGFSLNAASDVSAFDASNNTIAPSGMFPMMGSTFTVTTPARMAMMTITTMISMNEKPARA
jgi:hypothetical protein